MLKFSSRGDEQSKLRAHSSMEDKAKVVSTAGRQRRIQFAAKECDDRRCCLIHMKRRRHWKSIKTGDLEPRNYRWEGWMRNGDRREPRGLERTKRQVASNDQLRAPSHLPQHRRTMLLFKTEYTDRADSAVPTRPND